MTAFLVDEVQDTADHGLREDDFALHPRFANLGDSRLVREVGGGADIQIFAVAQGNFVIRARVRDDEVEIELALKAFANNVHVEKTEEADTKTETKNRGVFRLEVECGIRHGELLDSVFQILILVVRDWEKASIDERKDIFVAGERLGGGRFGEGDSIADFGLAGSLQVRDDVADASLVEALRGGHFRRERTNFERNAVGLGRHHADFGVFVDLAFKDANIKNNAAIIVKIGIEDESASGTRRGGRLARFGRFFDDAIEDFINIEASFSGNRDNFFGRATEKVDDLGGDFFDVGGRKVDFVDDGYNI